MSEDIKKRARAAARIIKHRLAPVWRPMGKEDMMTVLAVLEDMIKEEPGEVPKASN